MATFRAALTALSSLTVAGARNNYDLDELPHSLHNAQLPALLAMPIELEAERLFRERKDSLQTAAFSGATKSVKYSATHLLLLAPVEAGLGGEDLRDILPPEPGLRDDDGGKSELLRDPLGLRERPVLPRHARVALVRSGGIGRTDDRSERYVGSEGGNVASPRVLHGT